MRHSNQDLTRQYWHNLKPFLAPTKAVYRIITADDCDRAGQVRASQGKVGRAGQGTAGQDHAKHAQSPEPVLPNKVLAACTQAMRKVALYLTCHELQFRNTGKKQTEHSLCPSVLCNYNM